MTARHAIEAHGLVKRYGANVALSGVLDRQLSPVGWFLRISSFAARWRGPSLSITPHTRSRFTSG